MGIRISGGWAKGMSLKVPVGQSTRPTSAKVREAVWSSLQSHFPIVSMLDLFAGSGAMGLEAISRGVEQVTWVESDSKAVSLIKANLAEIERRARSQGLPAGGSRVTKQEVGKYLAGTNSRFDLIFIDPPYEQVSTFGLAWLTGAASLLAKEGAIVLECRRSTCLAEICPNTLRVVKEKTYGDTMVAFLEHHLE